MWCELCVCVSAGYGTVWSGVWGSECVRARTFLLFVW